MQHLKMCRSVSGYFQFKSKTVANVLKKKARKRGMREVGEETSALCDHGRVRILPGDSYFRHHNDLA